jgi:uncharacterized membrane protein
VPTVKQTPIRTIPGEAGAGRRFGISAWRREALRTTFWLVPTVLVVAAVALFAVTLEIDQIVYHHHVALPHWITSGSADAGRQVVVAIAAAVITVLGVVFSITILALTLASQQFGPRMMRNFVRDLGNQMTLGVWVATFVYSVLVLVSIAGNFVPHVSITVAEALLLVDLAVLIYFIHHIATSIQLPEVIAGIARDLHQAVDAEFPIPALAVGGVGRVDGHGPGVDEITDLLGEGGVTVPSLRSGYLQFVGYGDLVRIAEESDAVIRLTYRPGHFVVAGRPLATVWPPNAAPRVATALDRTHLTGPHRTIQQDPVFAIDQLVEIAIRALSPAVNDTFTALTCIDWLSAGLCQISRRVLAEGVYRDRSGAIRLIEADPSYRRMVDRSFDKVRQAGRGMPAVLIRLLEAIAHIMESTVSRDQRQVLLRQAEMIMRGAEADIDEAEDLDDIRRRYRTIRSTAMVSDDSTTTVSHGRAVELPTGTADGQRRLGSFLRRR